MGAQAEGPAMSSRGAPFIFSIHGLVRGRVRGPAALIGPVERELQFFRDDGSGGEEALDLDIIINDDEGAGEEGPAGVSWKGRHLMARWRVEMNPAGTAPMVLRFRGNLASRFILSKWIVEPAVRVVVEQKGAAMLHGAALSDGGRAVLVAGAGGAGKTTWALAWIAAGHPYLSDDFTVVQNGRALPYITPLRLGLMNLMTGNALAGLPFIAKAEIAGRTLLRRASLGRVKLYYKAMPQAAVPGIRLSGAAEVAGAIWIEGRPLRGTGGNKLSSDEMAARMTEVDRAEMHGFGGPAQTDRGILPADFWAAHQSRLADALRGKPCFSLPSGLPPPEAVSSMSSLMEWARRASAGR
jgi:hypothetical protein